MSLDSTHEYLRSCIHDENVVVHKIVADAFRNKLSGWMKTDAIDWKEFEIDHVDKNKKHNCLSNLHLVPRGSHRQLCYDKGERKRKLSLEDVAALKDLRRRGCKVCEIAKRFGVSKTRVYQLTAPAHP
jgi:hypothetical protein